MIDKMLLSQISLAVAFLILTFQQSPAQPKYGISALREPFTNPKASDPSQHHQIHTNIINNYDKATYKQKSLSHRKQGDCKNNYEFDYIQLTLQWPPGFCRTHPEGCSKSQDRHFTIHGMWPTQTGTEEPSFCCYNNIFDLKALEPIMDDLEEYWPSLTSKGNGEFWSHEWLKHGTCSKNAPHMMGELNYFNETLMQTKSLGVLDSLKASGFRPSMTEVYKTVDIQNALGKVIGGAKVQIDCDLEHHQSVPILTGINFCFDRNMNFVDCRPNKSRCSRNIYLVDS